MGHSHAYEVLFDGFAQAPSLHEPWPSFNLLRLRLAQRLGGAPRKHTRLMLSLWSLLHGTAMLLIRGGVAGPLRTQMFHACLDAVEAIVDQATRSKGRAYSGPKWPSSLILGEAAHSRVANDGADSTAKSLTRRGNPANQSPAAGLHRVRQNQCSCPRGSPGRRPQRRPRLPRLLRRLRPRRLRFQPVNPLLRFHRLWTVRQNLQITFVFRAGVVEYPQLLQADCQPDRGHRVVVFVT